MKLTDLFESLTYRQDLKFKIKTMSNGGTQHIAECSIDDENYELYFNLWDLDLDNQMKNMVEFCYTRKLHDSRSQKRVPSKHADKVHGLMLNSIYEYVKKNNVDIVVFSAKNANDESTKDFDTRSMIYDRIAHRLMGMLGMYLTNSDEFTEYLKNRKLSSIRNNYGRHWILTNELSNKQAEILVQLIQNLVLVPHS